MTEQAAHISDTTHAPVLLHEVLSLLALTPESVVVDCTAGGGGHAEALLAVLGPKGRYIGIDADDRALARVRKRLGDDARVTLVCGNFRAIETHLASVGCSAPTGVLADLGFSSDQLAASGRGFSLLTDEPLLMTFTATLDASVLTAWHVVNEWSEASLTDVIFGYGGERHARKIARAIVEERDHKPITTSGELAEIVKRAVPRGKSRLHPATKTFQALRIAVNDELGALQDLLEKSVPLLAKGGRIGIISFHSLEDRIVKHTFRAMEREGVGRVITKHPVVPTELETRANPRARSAKFRVFEKY